MLVLAANLWVGGRIAALTNETSIGDVNLLDAQVAAFGTRAEAVRVLVFGNSHAFYGLRPPQLAAAFDLPPDGGFNLGLPGNTAPEAIALANRYLAGFPGARAAIVQVDEVFVGTARVAVARRRFLSRFDPAERLRQALYEPRLDARLATLTWLPFPIADFNAQLQDAWATDRAEFCRQLLSQGGPTPAGPKRWLEGTPAYAWGFPVCGQNATKLQLRRWAA